MLFKVFFWFYGYYSFSYWFRPKVSQKTLLYTTGNYFNDNPIGCFLEFDFAFSGESHDLHNDYPLSGVVRISIASHRR